MLVRLLAALVAMAFLAPLSPVWAGEGGVYTVSRAPQLSVFATARTWQPFVDYLSRATGFNFKLKLYKKRAVFETDINAGTPDFFFGNPGYIIVGNKLHGYQPLIRSSARTLNGIIVVRAESRYKTVKDLDGLKIAFPDKNALASSLYIRALLAENEQIKFEPVYVGGHDKVYQNVANGSFEAGGGIHRTLNRETPALRLALRVLYETPDMSPHPLSAHPRVPATVRAAVSRAVLKLADSETGRKMLKSLKIEKPVAADFERDYRPVEKLALKMYAPLLEKQVAN